MRAIVKQWAIGIVRALCVVGILGALSALSHKYSDEALFAWVVVSVGGAVFLALAAVFRPD